MSPRTALGPFPVKREPICMRLFPGDTRSGLHPKKKVSPGLIKRFCAYFAEKGGGVILEGYSRGYYGVISPSLLLEVYEEH